MRPLNTKEIEMLNKLLAAPIPGAGLLRGQLKDCLCEPTGDADNYGSIYLFPSVAIKAAAIKRRVPVEALVTDADGAEVNVLLHVVDGMLNELEVVRLDGQQLIEPVIVEKMNIVVNS